MTCDTVNYAYYRESLESLGCPYISALDNESLRELVFRPGEARLRLFSWLLSQISPHVDTELNSPVLNAQVKDSKVQRLLKVCSGLGLCGKNDYELVQGNCSVKRQNLFYTRVMGMLSVNMTTPRDAELSDDKNTLTLCNNSSRLCYNMVDTLVNSHSYKDLFTDKLDIFPASLMCFNKSSKKTLPDLVKLQERSNKLSEELETLMEKLAAIQNSEFEELDGERVMGHRKTASHTLNTLNQILHTFTDCYKEEFKQWSDRPTVHINNIGPLCRQLDEHLTKIEEFMSQISAYNTSVSYLDNVDFTTTLAHPSSQSEVHELGERLKTLQQFLESCPNLDQDASR